MSTATPTPDHKPLEKPYPGLRPFTLEESYLFFGRNDMRNQLLDRLSVSRFLAVIGESGCGKSSLFMAGVLPDLQIGYMPGAKDKWRIATMRPGSAPFENLARAMEGKSAFGSDQPVDANQLRWGLAQFLSLMDATSPQTGKSMLPDDTNLLILVDQFEEIFRYVDVGNSNDAEAFVRLLLDLAEQRMHAIYIAITMRTDFLGNCAKFYGLPEAINTGQFLVPRLSKFQLRQAIVEPAKVFDCQVEEKLVNQLLADVGTPDYLPIIQHALMRLYEVCQGSTLTLEAYREMGGFERTLSNHANEAYDRLSPENQKLAETIFRCLSTREKSYRRDTRNPTLFREIVDICLHIPGRKPKDPRMDKAEMEARLISIIDTFRHSSYSFITPALPEEIKPDTVLDISHETLIRQWTKMCGDPEKEGREKMGWVKLEARKRKTYNSLADEAQLWGEKDKNRSYLAKKSSLDQAEIWEEEGGQNLAWAIRNDTPLAWKTVTDIRKLRDTLTANPRDESLSVQYREKLSEWCTARYKLTIEWLKETREEISSKRRRKVKSIGGIIILFLIALLAVSIIIGKPLLEKKRLRKAKMNLKAAPMMRTPEEANNEYKKAFLLGDNSILASRGIIGSLRASLISPDAFSTWQEYVNANPDYLEAKFFLAEEAIKMGYTFYANQQYEEILDSYEDLYQWALEHFSPEQLDHNLIKGRIIAGKLETASVAMNNGRYNFSIEILKQVEKLEPDSLRVFLGLSDVYSRKGDFEKARHYFNKIIMAYQTNGVGEKDDRTKISALLNLGEIYIKENKYGLANEHFEKVIAIDPNNLAAHLGLFSIFFRQGDYSQAKKQYHIAKVISLGKNLPPNQVRMEMASLLIDLNDFKEAETLFEVSETGSPNRHLSMLLGLGAVYHGQGKYDQAIDYFKKAKDESNCPIDIYLRLGSSYLASNHYVEAENAYSQFIADTSQVDNFKESRSDEKSPTRLTTEQGVAHINWVAYAWVGMGYAQKALGKRDAAETSFQNAAQIDENGTALPEFHRRNHINGVNAMTRESSLKD